MLGAFLRNRINLLRVGFMHYSKKCSKGKKKSKGSGGKPKIFLTRQINKESFKVLKSHCDVTAWNSTKVVPREEILKNVPGKDALFCLLTDKIDKEVLDAGKDLKVIATMSVGFDHLDLKEIKKRNIRIGYTPGVLTDATAELTIGLLLATSRRFFEANEAARKGEWSTWSPFWMCGPGLAGATVGIVGLGGVGQQVGCMLQPFKPKKTLYFNPLERKHEFEEATGAEQVSFDKLLQESDFVIVNIAMAKETVKMFNEEAFKKMKPTSIFVNTARGGIVDQPALVKALENKTIAGAGLDVMDPEPIATDDPLLKMKNCVILPHIASATFATRNAMAMLTVNNIIKGLEGEEMPSELK